MLAFKEQPRVGGAEKLPRLREDGIERVVCGYIDQPGTRRRTAAGWSAEGLVEN
jgi:hypothetical protein